MPATRGWMLTLIINYWPIIAFYAILILILIWKRKHWAWESKVLILYRTKWGLKFIEKISQRYREWIKLLGYIGIGAGYVGLVGISYILIKNLIDLLVKPKAISGMSLVLPGVNVPGMGVLPFWYWLVAIFIIAIVHEFSHGIVARAHGLPLKSTGFVFLGPIIGAFVEPDEKKMEKSSDVAQYSVLAAGSFSNILLALLAALLLSLALMPAYNYMTEPGGVSFAKYFGSDFPAAKAGIPEGSVMMGVNGQALKEYGDFEKAMRSSRPGETISLTVKEKKAGEFQATNGEQGEGKEKEYLLVLAANPDDASLPFLGITEIKNEREVKEQFNTSAGKILYGTLSWFMGLFKWLFLLSLGIGLFNLLPLPIVDGGKMLQLTMHKVSGREKGERRFRKIALFFLALLLFSLFFPLLKKGIVALF